jgi:branched-chain amino acid transport system substrate-binding protein
MKSGKAVSTTVAGVAAVVALVVGLLIGGVALGPVISPPPAPQTRTVTQTVTAGAVTVTQTVTGPGTTVTATVTSTVAAGLTGEVKIGALLPLTGIVASLGENWLTALDLAQREVNDYLKRIDAGFTIKLVVEDTELKPETADVKLKSLVARGITLMIGPPSSTELRRVKSYADANKILLLNHYSTAPDLSIPDDFVMRFCPDDAFQAPIVPRLAKELGAKHIIYVWRGDAWGDGQYRVSSGEARKLGLTVYGEGTGGIRYAPENKEFATEVATLANLVKKLIAQGVKPDEIFIEYIALGEAAVFIESAADYPELSQVRWLGTDGTALLDELVKDPKVASFSAKVKWIHYMFTPAENEKNIKVREYVKQKLGREPDSFTYSIYDILWVYALTLLQVRKVDADLIRKVIPEVASRYYGALGPIILNKAGDLARADYTLWAIVKVDNKYEWQNVGTFSYDTGTFKWKTGYP